MTRPTLSVVIPAYNEATRLPRTVERVVAWVGALCEPVEVIVVDDGSTDATSEIATAAGPPVTLLRLARNSGKGAAVRAGVLASRGALVLITDADLSAPIEESMCLRAAIEAGSAIAIGSRSVRGARIGLPQPLKRRVLGRVFNALVQLLVLPGIQDTQCGFKLLDGDAARRIFASCRIDGFAFDVEALLIARRLGLRIAEVPVAWSDSPDSRVQTLRDPLRMLAELVQIRVTARDLSQDGVPRLTPARQPASHR